MMAPPQIIISQPTPQQDNSLLSSYLTSKLINESNAPGRGSIPTAESAPVRPTDVAPPMRTEGDRPPIIPPPIKIPIVKPADITPSKPIIKPSIPTPPIITPYIKPAEVAPPTTTGEPKFFKKLKDTASTVADAASSELGTSIIEYALNGVDKTHMASTLVGTALRAHRNRKENTNDADEEIKRNEIKKLRELHKNENRTDIENALFNTLKTKYTGVKTKSPPKEIVNAANKIKAATMGKLFSDEYNDIITQKRAVDKIGSAMQSKQYSNALNQFKTINKTLSPAIKQAVTRNKYIKARDRYLDKKEGNKLNTMEAQLGYIENVVKKADEIQNQKEKEAIDKKINASIKQQKLREDAALKLHATMKTKLTKQHREAKKELRSQHVGKPLVVAKNTKELILKGNRDRGIKAQQAAASKKNSKEQEKIINFAKFMLEQK